MKHQRI